MPIPFIAALAAMAGGAGAAAGGTAVAGATTATAAATAATATGGFDGSILSVDQVLEGMKTRANPLQMNEQKMAGNSQNADAAQASKEAENAKARRRAKVNAASPRAVGFTGQAAEQTGKSFSSSALAANLKKKSSLSLGGL